MSNKLYDILKYIALIGVPAIVVFLSTLGEIWGIPYTSQITATISAIGICLGTLLQVSSVKYQKEEEANNEEDQKAS